MSSFTSVDLTIRYRKVIYCLDVANRLHNFGSGILSFSILPYDQWSKRLFRV